VSPRVTTVKKTIPSDYADAREIQRMVREEVEKAGYDLDAQFAVKLALEEAMINAIKHGNQLDPTKRVHVEWQVTPKTIEITIEDEGPGFDRKSVPDPTTAQNLEKLTGRGILLIESFMHKVEWSKDGRRLKLIRHNTPTQARSA
jgi:serine/threonine-protein kinase RsbW